MSNSIEISPAQARLKLTELFVAARDGNFTAATVIAADLEKFITWAELNCPATTQEKPE